MQRKYSKTKSNFWDAIQNGNDSTRNARQKNAERWVRSHRTLPRSGRFLSPARSKRSLDTAAVFVRAVKLADIFACISACPILRNSGGVIRLL